MINLEQIIMAKELVVHGGTPHLDDFLFVAICRWIGFTGEVFRRDPSEEEITSDEVIVGDVGMTHNPDILCWDHHQRGRQEAPKCAYQLLLEDLGLWEEFKSLFTWLKPWSSIDAAGPFATAKSRGLDWNKDLKGFLSPTHEVLLNLWAENYDNPIGWGIVKKMSDTLEKAWKGLQTLKESGKILDVAGIKVGDVRGINAQGDAQDAWIVLNGIQAVVFDDNRCPGGTGVLRVNDDPHLDFSFCEPAPYCGFCKPFICKVLPGFDPLVAIADAVVNK